MAAQPAATNDHKLAYIFTLLDKLLCFTPEEVDDFKNRIPSMDNEGLDKLVQVLEDAKKQQDEFFTQRVKEDPDYARKMQRFLRRTTNKLRAKYESGEREKAEEILEDIEMQ